MKWYYYCIYCCTSSITLYYTNSTKLNYLTSMEKQNFIILEDSQLLCNGLRTWLKEEDGYKVMMQTGDWTEFKQQVLARHRTHVISSFQWILKNPGLEEFNEFFKKCPWVVVVCLDDGSPTFSSISLVDSTICGVINLTSNKEEFLWGVKNVVEGRFYVSRKKSSATPGPHENLNEHAGEIHLSKREEDILNYISLGYSDKEIGELLFLSKRTVNGYRTSLLQKFGAKNSAHLARFATERNYRYVGKSSYN
jgi:two-component system, NarL family, response regulator NreC